MVVGEGGGGGGRRGGGVALLEEGDAEVGLTGSSSRVSGEAAIFVFCRDTATVSSASIGIKLAERKT